MALTYDEEQTIREIFAREQERSGNTSEEAAQSFWSWLSDVTSTWSGFKILNYAWEVIKGFLGF